MPDEDDGWFTTGETYRPELVALPGRETAPIGKTEVSLYKIDWRWWWESGKTIWPGMSAGVTTSP